MFVPPRSPQSLPRSWCCRRLRSNDSETAQSPSPTPQATSSPRPASTVGRWEVLRPCEGMVEALNQAGLRELAPSVVGDYFPDKSPKQLARKADICQRATPHQHSHFFTDDGQFGSLDQHEQQADDTSYSVVDDRTLRLSLEFGEETYRYRIVAGNDLTLDPIIPTRAKTRRAREPAQVQSGRALGRSRLRRAHLEAGRMRRLVLETSLLLLRDTTSSAGGRWGDCRNGRRARARRGGIQVRSAPASVKSSGDGRTVPIHATQQRATGYPRCLESVENKGSASREKRPVGERIG